MPARVAGVGFGQPLGNGAAAKIAGEGRLVVAGYYGGPVVIWDRDSNKTQTLDTRDGGFRISKDGQYLTVRTGDAADSSEVLKGSDGFTITYTTSGPAILGADKWVTIENGIPAFHPLVEASAQKSQKIENYIGEDEVRRFSQDDKWLVSLDKRRYCFWRSPFQSIGKMRSYPDAMVFRQD
jgi:hypothetical protein